MADSDGFHVDTEALTGTAAAVRAVADSQREQPLTDLVTDPAGYGDGDVHAAVARFASRWSEGLDLLTDDATTIADALAATVDAYRLADELGATRLTTGAGDTP